MIWRFFKPSPRRVVEDPVFGRLLYMHIKRDPSRSYWEGGGVFAPTGAQIEYFVNADEGGPGEGQRALYRQIAARWPELREVARRMLAENHREQFGSALADVWEVYAFASVSIPVDESPEMEWELTFESKDDGHLYTVEMTGWRPLPGVRMDG